ncbi:MAG TPA: right-handed parallel beta-helix repeat-containing protein, partial [Kofleriaceae bacterium]|nr:right-handed parallel beta-helix repeat-containing protein [Kofleriaceae bacterium]
MLDHVAINRAIYNLTYRSTGTGNALTNVTADAAQSYGLYLHTGNLTIDRFTATGAGSVGIYVGDSASPTFTSCVVRNNGGYGVYVAHT